MKRIIVLLLVAVTVFSLALSTSADGATKDDIFALLKTHYDRDDYTEESYFTYLMTVSDALEVCDKLSPKQSELDAAYSSLKAAIEGLRGFTDPAAIEGYISALESHLYNKSVDLSTETERQIRAAISEFHQLIDTGKTTELYLFAAKARYEGVIELVKSETAYQGFDKNNPPQGVIIPEGYEESLNSSEGVTVLRTQIALFGMACMAVGGVAVFFYFAIPMKIKPPKEPKTKR